MVVINAYGDAETKRWARQNGAEALTDQSIGTLDSEFDIRVERAPVTGVRSINI
jgi:hypothetical protein